MKVIYQSREFSKIERYLMTIAPSITSMKDVEEGETLTVKGHLRFVDEKDNGEETEVLSVLTSGNRVYSTTSNTFIRSFNDIADLFNGLEFTIVKKNGKTKSGRDYINCELYLDGAFEQ